MSLFAFPFPLMERDLKAASFPNADQEHYIGAMP